MYNDTVLSICIPTYNRLSELKECLDSVFAQNNSKLEIFISDNSTNNATQDYVDSIMANHTNLKYKHNTENLGADGNFLQCLQMASGQYVMLLADDDKLKDDCIEKIFDFIIQEKEVDFIELNSIKFDNQGNYSDTAFMPNDEVKIYKDAELNEFFSRMGIMLTFVSTMVFNKKSFATLESPQEYFNSSLLQTHIAIACMQRLHKAAVIPTAVVYGRADNSSGYNIYEVFIKNWRNVLFKTALPKKIIDKNTAKSIFSETIKSFVSGYLVREKINGKLVFATKNKARYFKYAFTAKGAWTRLYPIWLTPKCVLKFIVKRRDYV